jgi:hypothetical protein
MMIHLYFYNLSGLVLLDPFVSATPLHAKKVGIPRRLRPNSSTIRRNPPKSASSTSMESSSSIPFVGAVLSRLHQLSVLD